MPLGHDNQTAKQAIHVPRRPCREADAVKASNADLTSHEGRGCAAGAADGVGPSEPLTSDPAWATGLGNLGHGPPRGWALPGRPETVPGEAPRLLALGRGRANPPEGTRQQAGRPYLEKPLRVGVAGNPQEVAERAGRHRDVAAQPVGQERPRPTRRWPASITTAAGGRGALHDGPDMGAAGRDRNHPCRTDLQPGPSNAGAVSATARCARLPCDSPGAGRGCPRPSRRKAQTVSKFWLVTFRRRQRGGDRSLSLNRKAPPLPASATPTTFSPASTLARGSASRMQRAATGRWRTATNPSALPPRGGRTATAIARPTAHSTWP